MIVNKDAKIIGVWGGRGSGKSTGVKERTKAEKRVIVIDPIGDYAAAGFTAYKTFRGLYNAIKNNWKRGFRVVLDVSHSNDPEQELLKLSADLLKIQMPYFENKDDRKIVLIVEEMSILSPNVTKARGARAFLKLCNLGRHYGVEIIGVSQRPAEVTTNFRGNCAQHFYYRLSEARDFGAAAQIIGRKNAEMIRSLKTHEFILFENGGVTRGRNKLK